MHKKVILMIMSASIATIAGCSEKSLDAGCKVGDTKCDEGVVYSCSSDPSDYTFWKPSEICEFRCDENYPRCICSEQCAYGCSDANITECKCKDDCKYGCNEMNGMCIKFENCVTQQWNSDGSCVADNNCENGANEDGSCKNENCINGWNGETSSCMCPDACLELGCDGNGACLCQDNCLNGCDNKTGKCICKGECLLGCLSNGACITSQSCETDESCDDYTYCVNHSCYCSRNTCIPKDANHNHMDDRMENAVKQGESCRKHSDCDSSEGSGDGFCDSFIGYHCSTKCTNSNQCISDGNFQYICRNDGRCAPDSFITVWAFTEADKTDDKYILTLPSGTNCDFDIYWDIENAPEDSEHIAKCNVTITHEYNEAKKYTVMLRGIYDGFSMYMQDNLTPASIQKHPNAHNLVEVKAFGPVGLNAGAFSNCINLNKVSEIDIPDSSKLKDMSSFFRCAETFNDDIENWDVSNVHSMCSLFSYAVKDNYRDTTCNNTTFNKALNKWDVSKVETFQDMFDGASSFNQPLDEWDTSSATNMANMFNSATSFNSMLFTATGKVKNMSGMFQNAVAFNQPLSDWDTSKVTDMSNLFNGATSFNQNISTWSVSKSTNLCKMFDNTRYIINSDSHYREIIDSKTWEAKPWDYIGGVKHSDTCSYY